MNGTTKVGKRLADLDTLKPLVPVGESMEGYNVWLGSVISLIAHNVGEKMSVCQNGTREFQYAPTLAQ